MIKTTLVYVENEDCYLLLHRVKKQGDINKDKWIGIGGKFEDDESPEQCAKREMTEETGLTAHKLDYRGIVYFHNSKCESEEMHLFTCRNYSGTMHECDEGELEWVNKKEVYRLDLWEGDKIFLERLKGDRTFFRLELVYDGDTLISHRFL